jgi:hypothetical protein
VSLLRRLFRGQATPDAAADVTTGAADTPAGVAGAPAGQGPDAGLQADERAYERELMRAEAERLSSDLLRRQVRYADRSWTPPAQGGEQRATLGGGEARSD